MPVVDVECARCHKQVKGLEGEGYSSGFYRRGPMWGKYMEPNENVLCDDCMQQTDGYKRDFVSVIL